MQFFTESSGHSQTQTKAGKHWLIFTAYVLGGLFLFRFITLAHLPYLDPSESRYALVGKIMSDDGELFTPKVYKDGAVIPFLSKPPLHFWLEVASIEIFGMNQAAVRLPSFITALIMLFLTCYTAFRLLSLERALISGCLLFTSGLFFYMAGTTLVDMTLSAAITGVMASFLLSSQQQLGRERNLWGYLFFVFLAMGMLTKGPLALIFPGLSIFLWCAITKEWNKLKALPWLKGSLLFLFLTVPIFLLIEHANPGFLKYFFLNENLLRYLIKDYGDRFGSGHRYPYGSSWMFLLAAFFPWTFVFIPLFVKQVREGLLENKVLLYFICWAVGPALFLTFAKQLLGTYLLPSLGGLALFTGATFPKISLRQSKPRTIRLIVIVMYLFAALSLAITLLSFFEGISSEHVVISICILALLSIVTSRLARQQHSFQLLTTSALILTIAYTSGILSFCAYTGQFISSVTLMNEVDERYESSHPTLYFPFGAPLSAYLYQDKNEEVVDGGDASTLTVKDDNTLIIVRDKQVDDLHQRFGNNFHELLQTGKWRVFHKEAHEGSCERAMARSHNNCTLHAYLRKVERHA